MPERHRCREPRRVEVAIGGPAGDMIVPASTDRMVEQDALEAMVCAYGPAALAR